MKDTFYITTAIDYANDKPHIGHAYEKVLTDVIARFQKARGKDVFFLTGTDEHGEKVFKAAKKKGEDPQKFVDDLSERFRNLCTILSVENDDFIRTTHSRHEEANKKIVKAMHEKGDIYKGEYEGWYCVPCESYWTDKQLDEGKCPECNREVEKKKEEGYFFRLSKYEEDLLELYDQKPDFVFPESRKKELLNRIEDGLRDLCITRSAFEWGVPFPIDDDYTTYVWVDALSNYITALGYPEGDKFNKYWPANVHMIGKDITWFHAVIWPAMLMSLGVDLPETVCAHGFLNLGGEKMSKSKGNVLDPFELVEAYGTDALRYSLLSGGSIGEDSDFSEELLVKKLNNELADNLGNFVHRTLSFLNSNFGGGIPEREEFTESDEELVEETRRTVDEAGKDLEELSLNTALEKVMALSKKGNQYLNANEPWKNEGRAPNVLNVCGNLCKNISIILFPFLPDCAEKIWEQLGIDESIRSKEWGDAKDFELSDHEIGEPEPLFKKRDIQTRKKEEPNMIEFRDFQKLDLRAAKVKNVEEVEGADKLFKISLDVGSLGERTVAAGLKPYLDKEDLKGKTVAYLANLEPKEMYGMKSEGMVLAGEKNGTVKLVECDIEPGARIH